MGGFHTHCGCNRVQISTKLSINFTHSWEHQLQLFIYFFILVCVFCVYINVLHCWSNIVTGEKKYNRKNQRHLYISVSSGCCEHAERLRWWKEKSWKYDDYYNVVLYWCFQTFLHYFDFLLQSHKNLNHQFPERIFKIIFHSNLAQSKDFLSCYLLSSLLIIKLGIYLIFLHLCICACIVVIIAQDLPFIVYIIAEGNLLQK